MKFYRILICAVTSLGAVASAGAGVVTQSAKELAENTMNAYGDNFTDGDRFGGLTRKVGFDRMFP